MNILLPKFKNMYFFGFLLLSFMQYFILSAWNLTKTLPQEGAASLILSCHSHSSVLSFLKIWADIKLLVTCWHLVSRFFNLCKDFFLTSAALYLQESSSLLFLLYILQCFNTVPKVQIFSFLGGVIHFSGKNKECERNSAKLADGSKPFGSGHKKKKDWWSTCNILLWISISWNEGQLIMRQ